MHELVVRARQLASVAQLVRALHWNRRFDSCQGPKVVFFASVPSWLGLINVYKFPLDNFRLQYLSNMVSLPNIPLIMQPYKY